MNSTGKTGEKLAELSYRQLGWTMQRHQPETKVIWFKGNPKTIQCRSDGVSDYTGYEEVQIFNDKFPIYRACEVKEASGDSMPCSRLDKAQRKWLANIDQRSSFVGVAWMENMAFELFRFKPNGSYKKGEGVKTIKYQ